MLDLIQNIPNIKKNPLEYVLNDIDFKHDPDTLWMEFGVASGTTINKISSYTTHPVYGFDSFEGLPEDWRPNFKAGAFTQGGKLPRVNHNVKLIKGLFSDTLPAFLKENDKKVSLIHIDCDLYSSTKCIFDNMKDRIASGCILVFDELVNYSGFDGPNGELKALYEFITYGDIKYEWIGMNGSVGEHRGCNYEKVAMRIL